MYSQDSTIPRVFTLRAYGQTSIFRASSTRQLIERVYTRTSWTRAECARVALDLWAGRVVSAPDYETVLLPGRFDVAEGRPAERLGAA